MTSTPEAALAAVFDEAAAVYDAHWAPALNRHALALLEPVPRGPGLVAVDVAAGVGTLAPALDELTGPDGRVIALDRSLGMLRRAPLDLVRVQADAARLPLADAGAHVVVYGFVLFLLPDARRAVAEAARVLHPHGWLLAATWGTQGDSGADAVVQEELERVGAPVFPALPRSDALTDKPERMTELLQPAGFTDVRTQRRPLDAAFDQDSALAVLTGCGKSGWRFARLDPDVRTAVRQRVAARLADLPADAFVDRSEVLLTWARRADN
jgi:ubiquinone/menaquinone biosynthesis C-methylase UbiE